MPRLDRHPDHRDCPERTTIWTAIAFALGFGTYAALDSVSLFAWGY